MGIATGLVKTIVFIFNFLFVLAGLALIAIGAVLYANYNVKDLDTSFHIAPIVIIVIGSIIFLIAFLGCCGTLKQDTCLLSTYAGILITLLILQVAIIVYVYLQVSDGEDFEQVITKGMQKVFDKYKSDEGSKEFIDSTQLTLSCCGVKGPSDYLPDLTLPSSCCGNTDNSICTIVTGGYKDGCGKAMTNVIVHSSRVIGYVLLGISAVELIGSMLVCCLVSSIRNEWRRRSYA